jgi:hypothetical protein
MQLIDNSLRNRAQRAPEPLRPGLDVAVITLASDTAVPDVHLSVRGGVAPVRVYLYVDGDLRDCQTSALERFRITIDGLAVGRHAVTARAIDAIGRWGGASIVIDVPSTPERSSVSA